MYLNQQIEVMGQEMQMMQEMLQRVGQSMEATELRIKEQEASIKAYDAETKRIGTMQAGMSEEQIQDIVMGTISGMLSSADLVAPVTANVPPIEALPAKNKSLNFSEELPISTVLVVLGVTVEVPTTTRQRAQPLSISLPIKRSNSNTWLKQLEAKWG